MGKKRSLVAAEEAAIAAPPQQHQHVHDDKVKADSSKPQQEKEGGGLNKNKKKLKKIKLKATGGEAKAAPLPPVIATHAVADIDDLFADLARHKQTAAAAAAAAAAAEAKKKKKEQELQQKKAEKEAREGREGQRYDSKRDDPDVRPWKRDSAGMPIYDPDSMRVGKGGGTSLCPFDCNCCFG